MNKPKIESILTHLAPQPIGPYSQAVVFQDMFFCSGQIGLDPNGVLQTGITNQTRQIMENLKNILNASGSNFSSVLKSTIYLVNMDDFPVVNEIYASYFQPPFPARATIGVQSMPKGALVEIDMIALAIFNF